MSNTPRLRLYLCGPMTGIADHNRPAFNSAEAALKLAGYTVINPVRNGLATDAPWEQHLRVDGALILHHADALCLLPGWRISRGANREIALAKIYEIPVHPYIHWAIHSPRLQADPTTEVTA